MLATVRNRSDVFGVSGLGDIGRTMDQITLKNFRCFRDEQTARLSPLTLLVGENSTGKTSFLALIRALWDLACGKQLPNFKEPPYDLGSFDDIVHRRGGRPAGGDTFSPGVGSPIRAVPSKRFAKPGTASFPVRRRLSVATTGSRTCSSTIATCGSATERRMGSGSGPALLHLAAR